MGLFYELKIPKKKQITANLSPPTKRILIDFIFVGLDQQAAFDSANDVYPYIQPQNSN